MVSSATAPAKINGEAGSDNLQGGVGNDLIDAGDTGNDTLNGGDGGDGGDRLATARTSSTARAATTWSRPPPCEGTVLNGGPGEDNASFAPAGGFKVDATLGGTAVDPSVAKCTPTQLDGSNESLEGSFGNDHLVGNGSNNRLLGQGGDDILEGGGGNDTLNGSDGHDTLLGQTGKDELRGLDNSKDVKLDCGPPKIPELATRDKNDPPAINCGAKKKKRRGRARRSNRK